VGAADEMTEGAPGRMDWWAPAWAMLGVGAVFAWAVWRLGGRGVTTIRSGLDPLEWVVLALLTAAFAYGEGFLALDRRWVPRLVERARRLRDDRRLFVRALAPLYGLSLIGLGRRELLQGWLGTVAIIAAVLVIRSLPEPWRGIVDFAVAVALAWGLVAVVRRFPSALV